MTCMWSRKKVVFFHMGAILSGERATEPPAGAMPRASEPSGLEGDMERASLQDSPEAANDAAARGEDCHAGSVQDAATPAAHTADANATSDAAADAPDLNVDAIDVSDEDDMTTDSDEDAALGAVEDADWELSRGGTFASNTDPDFTKQYNRARQMATALQPSGGALPAVNRPRARAARPAGAEAATDDAGAQTGTHANKTAAQIAALSQYAERIHVDSAYDPSRAAGGSVDARVPRKTNRQDVGRRKDKADRATVQQVLDPRTLLILYKMIRRELLTEINGCISTGKEANVYHATTPAAEGGVPGSAAVKIYKTSILVFKDRDRYVSGEFRFRHGYARHNPRKMVRLWAEKEMRNLKRLVHAGLRAPAPIELRDHVLVMEFLGDADGWSSPRLKDAESVIAGDEWARLYRELVVMVRLMYQRCRLVHADLSEYNLLLHEGHLWIIDVSQSVEHDHPHAFDFLREDIAHIDAYFEKRGVPTLGLRQTFHFVVRDAPRTRGGVAGIEKFMHGDAQIDEAVTARSDAVVTDNSEAALEAEVAALMEQALEEPETHVDAAHHEESVFRQSYLPRTLDEICDPERDTDVVQAGGVSSLIYAGVTGLDEVYEEQDAAADAAPQPEAPQSSEEAEGDETLSDLSESTADSEAARAQRKVRARPTD